MLDVWLLGQRNSIESYRLSKIAQSAPKIDFVLKFELNVKIFYHANFYLFKTSIKLAGFELSLSECKVKEVTRRPMQQPISGDVFVGYLHFQLTPLRHGQSLEGSCNITPWYELWPHHQMILIVYFSIIPVPFTSNFIEMK